MKNLKYKAHKDSGQNANDVMKNGILIGCHQGLNLKDLKLIINKFEKFAKSKKL